MTSSQMYYDFMNPSQALKKEIVSRRYPLSYLRYVKDIVNTKVSMVRYKVSNSFPKLTSSIIETSLMFATQNCFYNSAMLGGWVLCRYSYNDTMSMYARPTRVNLTALNGTPIAEEVPYSDIIVIKDNSMDILPYICIDDYIQKIMHIEDDLFKMLDIGCLPVVVSGSKKQATALRKTAEALGCKNSFITGDDNLVDGVKSFNIDLSIPLLDIYDVKNKYKNECLQSLGIYAVDQKRERIVTQELVNQNDFTDFVYNDCMECRKEAIKELNRRGADIELIETYDINYDDSVEEKAKLAHATAVADGTYKKNTTEVNPNVFGK